MKIKPFEDFIVVRPLEVKEGPRPTKIHLSQKAREQAGMFDIVVAEVVAVGEGRLLECGIRRDMGVKEKDRIIFPMRGIPQFPLAETAIWQANGRQLPPLIVINVGHILGVLEEVGNIEFQYAEKTPTISED